MIEQEWSIVLEAVIRTRVFESLKIAAHMKTQEF